MHHIWRSDFRCICYASLSLIEILTACIIVGHFISIIIIIIIAKYSYHHKLDAYKVVDYYSKHFWVIK